MAKVIYEQRSNHERAYRKVSRWIKIDYKRITKRHRLYDFTDIDISGKKPILCYFRHKGKEFALGQFMWLSYPIILEDGSVISSYDCTQWFKPYLLEIHDNGGAVRLWEEIEVQED